MTDVPKTAQSSHVSTDRPPAPAVRVAEPGSESDDPFVPQSDPTDDRRTRVLFIGGEGRSGSTVLERLLAVHSDTCAVGELKNLFEMGIAGNELCGCGKLVLECDLWSEVGRRLVGGWDTSAGREMVKFFARINHRLYLPAITIGRGPTIARARSILAELYRSIADVSGSPVIIDSSKHPSWAYLLAGVPTIDLRIVQLVRHPSGVAYSWSKPVARPHATAGQGDLIMPAHSPVEVSIRWDVFNALLRRLAKRTLPTILLRYEDYVADLDGALDACLELVDLTYVERPDTMDTGHGIAGNPSRFAVDSQKIVEDNRWITEYSPWKHALVSAITWPARPTYGYRYSRSNPVRPLPGRSVGRSASR